MWFRVINYRLTVNEYLVRKYALPDQTRRSPVVSETYWCLNFLVECTVILRDVVVGLRDLFSPYSPKKYISVDYKLAKTNFKVNNCNNDTGFIFKVNVVFRKWNKLSV